MNKTELPQVQLTALTSRINFLKDRKMDVDMVR